MKIAVLKGPGVGDVITSMPLFENIRKGFPKAEVIAFQEQGFGEGGILLKNCPFIDRVISIKKKSGLVTWMQTLQEIRREHIDIVIDSFPSTPATALFCFLTGARVRCGYKENPLSFLYTHTVAQGNRNLTFMQLELLRQLGVKTVETEQKITLNTAPAVKAVDAFLGKERIKKKDVLVAIYPGRTQDHVRTWADDRWATVADWIAQRGAKVVFVGSVLEQQRTEQIRALMQNHAASFVGDRSLAETTELLKRTKLCLATNGGIMHLATAVGVRVIALCGNSKPGWDPYGKRATVIRKNVSEFKDTKNFQKKDSAAMELIQVEDVLKEVKKIL